MEKGPFQLIGISGGSCCGKTTLMHALHKGLKNLTMLSFDEYFVGTDSLGDTITDWESPTLYHYDRFVTDLAILKTGKAVKIKCNSRDSTERGIISRLVVPSKYTVVEGFLIFHEQEAREQFDRKIFIDIPEDEMIRRRMARRMSTDRWDDLNYINHMLINGYRRYVLPQRHYCDLVIDGLKAVEMLVEEVRVFMDELY